MKIWETNIDETSQTYESQCAHSKNQICFDPFPKDK